jgi:carbonic anhydrase
MDAVESLFENNRQWAERIDREQPGFFEQLSKRQSPEYLWIGCSDSRVPASTVLNLPPGGVFVHRNIANVISLSDASCMSVIGYAVDVLKVKHLIVCGHYGCGGVIASIKPQEDKVIDDWLEPIRDVYREHRDELESIGDTGMREDRLCELNVIRQAARACDAPAVSNAWKNRQELHVHGWIYRLKDGRLRDLGVSVHGPQ